ncbi:hypothetical protein [Saccharopolyspora sp. CA-218241]|uniref:hypothetical protein n=1 Tax=Saccharopolyspora sp. CA-218241 TaxID=3240027 RepID=UPI003D995720
MDVPGHLWIPIAVVAVALLLRESFAAWRTDGEPPPGRAVAALTGHLALGALLCLLVMLVSGGAAGGDFGAAWLHSLAVNVDSALVLLLLVELVDVPRGLLLVLAVLGTAAARVVLLGLGAPGGMSWLSAVFGGALLGAVWLHHRRAEQPPGALPRIAARPVAAVAFGALAAVVFAGHATGTGGAPGAVLAATLLALAALRPLCALLRALLGRGPAAVGLAAVLVFVAAKSLLAVLPGPDPAHDPRVVLLCLGMLAATAVLTAIGATREPNTPTRPSDP